MVLDVERFGSLSKARLLEIKKFEAQLLLTHCTDKVKPQVAIDSNTLSEDLKKLFDLLRTVLGVEGVGDSYRDQIINEALEHIRHLESTDSKQLWTNRLVNFKTRLSSLLWIEDGKVQQRIDEELKRIFISEIEEVFEIFLSKSPSPAVYTMDTQILRERVKSKVSELKGRIITSDQVDEYIDEVFDIFQVETMNVAIWDHGEDSIQSEDRNKSIDLMSGVGENALMIKIVAQLDLHNGGVDVASWGEDSLEDIELPQVKSDIEMMMMMWAFASAAEELREESVKVV